MCSLYFGNVQIHVLPFSFLVIQYEIKQLWEFIYKYQKPDLPLKACPRALSTWFEIKQHFLYQNENDENWVCGYNPKINKQYLAIESTVSHSGFLSNLRKLEKLCEFLAQGQTVTADLNCNVLRRLRESIQQKQFELWCVPEALSNSQLGIQAEK